MQTTTAMEILGIENDENAIRSYVQGDLGGAADDAIWGDEIFGRLCDEGENGDPGEIDGEPITREMVREALAVVAAAYEEDKAAAARSAAARAMGSAKSPAKAKAVRANGKKGGRPASSYPFACVFGAPGEVRVESLHLTAAAAVRAAEKAQRGLERHNPGGDLLCGYEARERGPGGEWLSIDGED